MFNNPNLPQSPEFNLLQKIFTPHITCECVRQPTTGSWFLVPPAPFLTNPRFSICFTQNATLPSPRLAWGKHFLQFMPNTEPTHHDRLWVGGGFGLSRTNLRHTTFERLHALLVFTSTSTSEPILRVREAGSQIDWAWLWPTGCLSGKGRTFFTGWKRKWNQKSGSERFGSYLFSN